MWFDEEDDGERIDSYTAQVTVDEPGTYTMKIKMETEHADLIGTGNGIVIEDPNTLTEVIIPNQVEAGSDFTASILIENEMNPSNVKVWVESYDIELDKNGNAYSTLLRLPTIGNYNLHFEITIDEGTFVSENYQIAVVEPTIEEETEEEDGMFVFETPSLGIIPIIVALLVMSFITRRKD